MPFLALRAIPRPKPVKHLLIPASNAPKVTRYVCITCDGIKVVLFILLSFELSHHLHVFFDCRLIVFQVTSANRAQRLPRSLSRVQSERFST